MKKAVAQLGLLFEAAPVPPTPIQVFPSVSTPPEDPPSSGGGVDGPADGVPGEQPIRTARQDAIDRGDPQWIAFYDQNPAHPLWAVFSMSPESDPLVEYAPTFVRDATAYQARVRLERLLVVKDEVDNSRYLALPAEGFEGIALALLPRWAVFVGPRFLELPPGVLPEIHRAPSAEAAVALASFRHDDGQDRWACEVMEGEPQALQDEVEAEPAAHQHLTNDERIARQKAVFGPSATAPEEPIERHPDPKDPSTWTPEFTAEFNRRVGEIFDEGRAARAAAGEAPADDETASAPARWQRPRGPVQVGDDELEDPGVIAGHIMEELQGAMLAVSDMAVALENPGQPAPIAPTKRLSKVEQRAADAEAEVRSPLEIIRDIRAKDHEIERSHDRLIEMLIPEGTKPIGLPALTACVVDGVAMVACAAGTVRLDLVLERLARTDSSGFVLLEDIAGEIARGEPLPDRRFPNEEQGDLGDLFMGLFTRSNRRAELEIKNLELQHAAILGCTLEELPARLAKDKAAEAAQRAADKLAREEQRAVTTNDGDDTAGAGARLGGRSKKARAATTATAPVDIQAAAQRRLTPRQIELARMINVVGDRAIYGDGTEAHIPDWSNLKKTMVALGGKWQPASSKGLAGFRWPAGVDLDETIRLAQETGEIYDATVVGFYQTPWDLARATAGRLGIQPGWRILEPEAGGGRLAVAARELGAIVSCIEPLADNRAALTALGFELVGEDFLAMDPMVICAAGYSGVVMNPPFANDADAEHILHAARFPVAGGPVVSIASAGVVEHSMGLGPVLRAFLASHGGTTERLPEGSFLESGTGVKTVVVAFRACEGCRSMTCRGGQ